MLKHKNYVIRIFLLSSWMFVTAIQHSSASEKIDATNLSREISISTGMNERRRNIADLQLLYDSTKQVLLKNLYDAKKNFIHDNTYFSPLHVAIIAVGIWQISSANESIINIVDYTINPTTLPVGIDVAGDFFYPVIRVLVNLRVDNDIVIEAIANAKNNKQISLLTWVLNECQGNDSPKTIGLLKNAIEKYNEQTIKNNLTTAIKLLQKSKYSSGLIPSPYKNLQLIND